MTLISLTLLIVYDEVYYATDRRDIVPNLREIILSANFGSPNIHLMDGNDLSITYTTGRGGRTKKATDSRMVQTFLEKYKEALGSPQPNPNHVAIINYNNTVHGYTRNLTKMIRDELFGDGSSVLNKGELVLNKTNISFTINKGQENEEEVIFGPDTKMVVKDTTEQLVSVEADGMQFTVNAHVATVVINDPSLGMIETQVNFIDDATIQDAWKSLKTRRPVGKVAGLSLKQIGAIVDGESGLVQYDYGYVINNFKVQGSGITHTIVDVENIFSSPDDILHKTTFLYTAVSRTTSQLYLVVKDPKGKASTNQNKTKTPTPARPGAHPPTTPTTPSQEAQKEQRTTDTKKKSPFGKGPTLKEAEEAGETYHKDDTGTPVTPPKDNMIKKLFDEIKKSTKKRDDEIEKTCR